MKKITQKDMILRHMRDYGSISSIEAFSEYGITRLAAVIHDIKNRDHISVNTEMCPTINRYGDTVKFARYSTI